MKPSADMAAQTPRSVDDVTITSELAIRVPRRPGVEAELAVMRRLADTLETDPSKTFQVCVESALELCGADTCGVSLRERTPDGEDIFRWIALAGQLKEHIHGTTPRFFSPCGICIDHGSPILMRRPELVYKYLDVGPPFHDVLLVPLTEKTEHIEGTIWVIAHNDTRKFDSEDARVMQRIAVFTATALHLAMAAQEAKTEASKLELLLRELDHRVKNTLAMTAGLLRLQLARTDEPTAREAIETASTRVSTIGRVHELATSAAAGNLAEVVRSICNEVARSNPRLEFKIDVETVAAAAQKSAVVALIVGELLTNAVKHGLSNRLAAVVSVDLHRRDDLVVLTVSDDGQPLPETAKNGSGGLGLELVSRLAKQISGELKVETHPKQFSVIFPA